MTVPLYHRLPEERNAGKAGPRKQQPARRAAAVRATLSKTSQDPALILSSQLPPAGSEPTAAGWPADTPSCLCLEGVLRWWHCRRRQIVTRDATRHQEVQH